MARKRNFIGATVFALPFMLFSINAHAVPSYARQTGMACAACHTVYPELTAFGRSFKMNGYTLTGIKEVKSTSTPEASGLKLSGIPPMSAMLQTQFATSKNGGDVYSLPAEFSLFFAGNISPKMGSFIQMTMEQGGNFELDNTDIRYATHSGGTTIGVTVNNSPTVQDLWNSTPAWGFPFTGGVDVAAPVIADALAQNVMGIGAYVDTAGGLYGEVSLYNPTGNFDSPSGFISGTATIKTMAPYARLAWEKTFNSGDSLMIGAYGMQASVYDTAGAPGVLDKYTDAAVDTQWQHKMGSNSVSVHVTYITEDQNLVLSPGGTGTLNALRVDGIYHWGYHATASLGYASNSGVDTGSSTTIQYSYLPWQNTKFTAQYAIDNNDSNNNTTLLQAWLMW
jgi:hypothetical protein